GRPASPSLKPTRSRPGPPRGPRARLQADAPPPAATSIGGTGGSPDDPLLHLPPADLRLDRRRLARRVVARVGVDRLDSGDGRRVGNRALLARLDDDRHGCGCAVPKIPQRTADGRPLCATAPLAGPRGPEANVAIQRVGEAHTARRFEALVP